MAIAHPSALSFLRAASGRQHIGFGVERARVGNPGSIKIMRLILFAASIALTVPSGWAQHTRHIMSPSSLARSGVRGVHSFAPRARKIADATAVTQAPGVVQLEYLNGTVTAWFVSTATIPKGSAIALTVAHDNGTEIDGDALNITADVGPGQSYLLPNVSSFGDLWS